MNKITLKEIFTCIEVEFLYDNIPIDGVYHFVYNNRKVIIKLKSHNTILEHTCDEYNNDFENLDLNKPIKARIELYNE